MTTDIKRNWWPWARAGLAVGLACLFLALVYQREGIIGVRAIKAALLPLALIFVGIWRSGNFEPFGWVVLIVFLRIASQ